MWALPTDSILLLFLSPSLSPILHWCWALYPTRVWVLMTARQVQIVCFFLKSFHQSLLQHLSDLVMQHKKRKEPLLWKPLPLKGIISSQMSLVPKGVKSLSAFAFWTGSATGLLPVRMLQTGNKGFCLGLLGSPGRCSRSCPLRSLVGAQGGEELSYVLFVTAVPRSQTLYWILFFFF